MKAEELTYNVRKEIEMKAKQYAMTFDSYFNGINESYCIKVIGDIPAGLRDNAGILCQGNGFYSCFDSRDRAESLIGKLSMRDSAKVITEAEAIKIMCDAESSVTHQIGEFSIKQLVGGGIEIRANDFKKNLISITPVVGNVIQVKCI